ncbi:spermidine/putrescine ABC transporter permease PotB [Legionella geestiana]|uniref:Spermidine/putrescine ABC transporter permease PotB n=1 Tax=Legionella geestiana TaxID=45065 RepID=A0A0W0TNA0_9GAMM|nr:spermidine/putrescine ABC transporter permease [Legionella geestiana]KTC97072.1 spermidine/putrescine ABC transporter permease PotB [Legionella geestiana]QBS11430.1 spermidine/putrescine ABC transporter permease PotB [Legionella geestiana]QDQ38987.1 spermidine/putrescine ABC transporter permease PotB [Legionella geestiana]STX53910.1 spermidine/putrescine ABC transporter permease PotB [Legionella geestiana]
MKTESLSPKILLLWLLLFAAIPLLMVVVTSLLSNATTQVASLPFTLAHYKALFSPLFANVMLRSLLTGLLTTFITLLLAWPFSYIMVKSRHQSVMMLLIIIPFWTSSLVRTYSLVALLKTRGLLNALLLKLHLISTPLPLLYTNFSVMVGLVYNLFPFMVLPLFTNMERFDFRLMDAAMDLGASRLRAFVKVFLPATAPGILAGCLLVFLPAMTLFYIPGVLGGARSLLLGNLIQNQFMLLDNWPQGAATSTLLTLMLLGMLALFRRRGVSL